RQEPRALRRAAAESDHQPGIYALEARRETGCAAARPARGAGRVLPLRHRRSERSAAAAGASSMNDLLLRHTAHTRVVHWAAPAFFVLAFLSGFAIYPSWLFRWLTPLFGGGPMTRLLHPWFSLGF